jgi:hypothetical protein
VQQVGLLVVVLGQHHVQHDVADGGQQLRLVLLDRVGGLDGAVVTADAEVVVVVLPQLDHVAIELQLELVVLLVLEKSSGDFLGDNLGPGYALYQGKCK